jgi:haloalkane dehalogenase
MGHAFRISIFAVLFVGLFYACGLGVMVVASTRPAVPTQPATVEQARDTLERLGLAEAYTFEHGFVETPHGRMHYAALGEGPPVLCVHGNPTWSFLYRHLLTGLADRHRVIAVDLIGFGLSQKPSDPKAYTVAGHIEDLEALIEALDLRDITLVVQDWGGPIGVGAAARHPERIRALVAMNTMAFVPDGITDGSLPLPLRILRVPILGEQLVQGFGLFNRVFAPGAIQRPDRRSELVRRAYDRVQGSWGERAGTLAFPRLIPADADDPAVALLREQDRFLAGFDGPVLLAWGMRDRAFSPAMLAEWRRRFPEAPLLELPDAGHFPQEDAHEVLVPWLREQLSAASPPESAS